MPEIVKPAVPRGVMGMQPQPSLSVDELSIRPRRAVDVPAVVAANAWMFALGLNRMELTHSTRNTPSCRVAERAGYTYEGTMRGRGLHADGWHDMHLHARLSTDS